MMLISPTKIANAKQALISEMLIPGHHCAAPGRGQIPEVPAEQRFCAGESAKSVNPVARPGGQSGEPDMSRPIPNPTRGHKSP